MDYIKDISKLLEPLIEGDVFLVEIKIKPTNNIKLFLDADSGMSIEKCIRVNRALYKKIEESGLFPNGDFSLEVSSPGVDEPLKLHRQYIKNIGRSVEATLTDGSVKTGKLTAVTDNEISLNHCPFVLNYKTNKSSYFFLTKIPLRRGKRSGVFYGKY